MLVPHKVDRGKLKENGCEEMTRNGTQVINGGTGLKKEHWPYPVVTGGKAGRVNTQ